MWFRLIKSFPLLLGAYTLSSEGFSHIHDAYHHFYRKPFDLKVLYPNHYCLITGASDGIGLEYARAMAAKGFPLILISNSGERLELVKNELEKDYGIDVQIIVFDFRTTLIDDYDKLFTKIGNFNIGFYINDVGVLNLSDLQILPFEKIHGTIATNIFSNTFITHYAIKNTPYAGILALSSEAGDNPSPHVGTYSGTKAYITRFYRSLNLEKNKFFGEELIKKLNLENVLQDHSPITKLSLQSILEQTIYASSDKKQSTNEIKSNIKKISVIF